MTRKRKTKWQTKFCNIVRNLWEILFLTIVGILLTMLIIIASPIIAFAIIRGFFTNEDYYGFS